MSYDPDCEGCVPEQPKKELEDPHTCPACGGKHYRSQDKQLNGTGYFLSKAPPEKSDPLEFALKLVAQQPGAIIIDGTLPVGVLAGQIKVFAHALVSALAAQLAAEQGKIKREEVPLIAAHMFKSIPVR